ncbi:MAG: DMT family transporter [Candidatus Pacebacteria bacterium]|nr:DMT family transporter [Candidatus Paceibacterota bacterium]
MGIFFALFASLAFAIAYTFLKRSYKEFPPSVAFFFDMLFGLLIWIPFSLMIGFDFSDLSKVLIYALISGILSEAFIFYILSKGEISITGTIFASYPVYTILFAMLILGERLSLLHWLFVIMTIVGTLLASLPRKISRQEWRKKTYILWAIAGATAVGLSDSISKGIIDQSSAAAFLFALALVQVPISLIYLRLEKEKASTIIKALKKWRVYKYAIIGSLFNVLGLVGLWLAFENTLASIASPLTAAYPGFMVILAVVWLKEKPSKLEWLGLILIMLGVVGIGRWGK